MAIKSITELKNTWKDGFIPKQEDYTDLFDTIDDLGNNGIKTQFVQINAIPEENAIIPTNLPTENIEILNTSSELYFNISDYIIAGLYFKIEDGKLILNSFLNEDTNLGNHIKFSNGESFDSRNLRGTFNIQLLGDDDNVIDRYEDIPIELSSQINLDLFTDLDFSEGNLKLQIEFDSITYNDEELTASVSESGYVSTFEFSETTTNFGIYYDFISNSSKETVYSTGRIGLGLSFTATNEIDMANTQGFDDGLKSFLEGESTAYHQFSKINILLFYRNK